jgi:hypothetical protein
LDGALSSFFDINNAKYHAQQAFSSRSQLILERLTVNSRLLKRRNNLQPATPAEIDAGPEIRPIDWPVKFRVAYRRQLADVALLILQFADPEDVIDVFGVLRHFKVPCFDLKLLETE